MKKCECGCGQKVKPGNRFIFGHQNRGKNHPLYGKHHTEESRKKISKSHMGKHHSEETKKKMSRKHHSEESKRKLSEANKGKNNPFYGKRHSEKTKQKMSEVKMGENNSLYGKHPSEETRKKLSEVNVGEKNGNWQGGISFEPYCYKFNNELKEKIRNRDNRVCQLCGKDENDESRRLSIHHIHYDKENCYPDLISLCCSCNVKVNFNRDYYEKYFMRNLFFRKIQTNIYNLESELGIWNYGDI